MSRFKKPLSTRGGSLSQIRAESSLWWHKEEARRSWRRLGIHKSRYMRVHPTSGRQILIIISGVKVHQPLLEGTSFSNSCLNSNGKRNLSRVGLLKSLTLGLCAPRMSSSKFINISMMIANSPIMEMLATSPRPS